MGNAADYAGVNTPLRVRRLTLSHAHVNCIAKPVDHFVAGWRRNAVDDERPLEMSCRTPRSLFENFFLS